MASLRIIFIFALGTIANLPTASASQYGHCAPTTVTRCRPVYCCPRPVCPRFCMFPMRWDEQGHVAWSPDRPIHVPASVSVTGYSCYCWSYTNAEYRFALYDDRGCLVRNALILTADRRCNLVCPGRSLVDDLGIQIAPGKLVLGRRYTLRVCLRGRSVSFPITPVIYSNTGGSPQISN